MADIRIKDLTTEVSSTATGDFFVIDGTTGTRRTPAFNPTFGGNATVTGTLTANGTITANSASGGILVNGAGITMDTDPAASSASLRFVDGATPRFWIYKLSGDSNLYFRDMTNGRMQFQMLPGATSSNAISTFNSILSVTSTTASTSTSSGALVVGNGTSGGLGVGGNIYGGGNIVSMAAGGRFLIYGTGNTTESKELTFKRSDDADNFTLGLTGSAYAGSLSGLGNNEAYLYNSGASAFRIFIGTAATNRFDFTQNQFKINPTTISNSTSSGALVVSGGVGVAGAIFAGGGISTKLSTNNSGSNLFAITRADGTTPLLTATDANDGLTLKLGYTGLGNSSNWISLSGNGGGPGANITLNNGVVASFGGIAYQVNGLSRWYVSRSTTAETGSNAGSDFAIVSYNDAGATIGTAFSITRSNSAVQCAGTLTAFGAISASSLNTANGTTVGPFTTSIGADATLGALTVSMGGSPSATGASRFGYIGAGDSQDWRRFIVGSNTTSGGGQVLVPSTLSSTSTSSGALVVSGGVGVAGKVTSTALGLANTSQSIPAWGDVGAQLSIAGAVITDTTSSGTVSRFVSNSISASSIAASSPTTYTQAASLFIAAGPTANTNVTITNSYALFIAGGRINFGGLPTSSAGLQAGTLWNDGGTLKVA